jgi:hypothetical protein
MVKTLILKSIDDSLDEDTDIFIFVIIPGAWRRLGSILYH